VAVAVSGAGEATFSPSPAADGLVASPFTVAATAIHPAAAASASLRYATYLGGSDFDQGNGVAADANGNAYATEYASTRHRFVDTR
jgi:hypothetical protein